MKTEFAEKSAVVLDWAAPQEDRYRAVTAMVMVPDSGFMVETHVAPFFEHVDPTLSNSSIGIVTAEMVANATSRLIVANNWQDLPFEDLAKILRDHFNVPASAEDIKYREENDFDAPEAIEIILAQRAESILAESELPAAEAEELAL